MKFLKRGTDNVVQFPARSRLETLIDEADAFGYLTLYRSDMRGVWRAYVEKKHRGAEVKVSAHGDHASPVSAMEELISKLRDMKS